MNHRSVPKKIAVISLLATLCISGFLNVWSGQDSNTIYASASGYVEQIDPIVPGKENQPENQSLVLWNKLGSDYEVTHSEIGPNGTILGSSYAFEPAKFGNGYVRKDVGVNYVSFPGTIFDTLTERGTIELWVNPKAPVPVPNQYGDWALIGTIYGHYGTPDDDNIRIIWGDESFPGDSGFFGEVKFDENYARTPREPVQFVATPYVPFHVAISWDILGIDGSMDTVRVYRDGEIVSTTTAAWNPNGTERHDIILGYIPDGGGYDKHIVDNIKIWNYAKTDFSDRFFESEFDAVKNASKSQAHLNDRVDFTITLQNSKTENISSVQVTDTLPEELDYIAGSLTASSGMPQYNNGVVSWNGDISPGSQVDIQFGTTVKSSVTLGSTVTNTAEINGDGRLFNRSASILVDYYKVRLPCVYNPCDPLYSDNFSNSSSGWPVGDNGNVRYEYLNGEYRLLVRPPNWGASVVPGFQAADYILAVDVRNLNAVNGSYGLVFGAAQDSSTLYSLEIYPDGWFGIYRYDPNDIVTLASAYSPAILQGSASNHLKIERNGTAIEAYANGQLLANVNDGAYTGVRYVGLAAFTYDQANLDVRFDNFIVYPISCDSVYSPTVTKGEGLAMDSQKPPRYKIFDKRVIER